ncbi:hypothetical protein E4S40_08535 [Algoriphagus kandeliae]|uniref:Uncharacterized protein n=1 Tax=Algoriphagus kandeliae TaxID=2562278 RepID=A0A4Y9QUR9_9BACT|nr:hypothetical protein [Algoriphagus kandeliae]TFV96259.1 hypothetical protein E4S40_08535 [Algoriphagus kandeliae]
MNKFQYLSILGSALLFSCSNEKKEEKEVEKIDPIIEVVTNAMDFQMVDSISSGWNTFRYVNKSNEVHFFVLEKLPEGIRLSNYENELIPVFKEGFDFMKLGNMEEGMKAFEKIPQWFGGVVNHGGVGILSGNSTGETTLFLEPGVYAMECYIRMPDGTPHVFMGMLKEVIVTDEVSELAEPKADYSITISSTEGIQFLDSIPAGNIEFGVDFLDQQLYEHFAGHDINLVKLQEGAELDSLVAWINPSDMFALSSPEPKEFVFMGGAEDMPAGKKAYFKAELSPGNYVLISEVPDAMNRKMVHPFTVY